MKLVTITSRGKPWKLLLVISAKKVYCNFTLEEMFVAEYMRHLTKLECWETEHIWPQSNENLMLFSKGDTSRQNNHFNSNIILTSFPCRSYDYQLHMDFLKTEKGSEDFDFHYPK